MRKGISDLAHDTTYMPTQHGGLRKATVQNIVIHHAAGVINGHALGGYLQNSGRTMTANYGIGNDGVIVSSLPEQYRPWTTSGADPDERSITIEVGNSDGGPNWPISKAAMQSLIKLVADIARRYGWSKITYTGDKTGTLLMHKWYAATDCPGPYLASKFGYVRDEVNKLLKADRAGAAKTDALYRVQVGAFSNPDNARKQAEELEASGHKYWITKGADGFWRVQVGAFGRKENALAMRNKLQGQGFPTWLIEPGTAQVKSLDELAREVLAGQWGNDPERTRRLSAAGHDAKAVQRRVNELLR